MYTLFFKTPFPGWISIPTYIVSLFIFYMLSYLLLKTINCLCRFLMSSACVQKLFCGIFSAFKCSFNEFVGEKVVSPSYSSAILGLPPIFLYFFALITEEDFLISPCYSLEHCIQMGLSFLVSFAFSFSSFHSICNTSLDSHFSFLHFFFLGMS